MMTAVGLLVRYADFITYLGGGEGQLGLIVGIGMVGSLAMRVGQGVGIDKYGPRTVWLGSLALFVASQLAHILILNAGGFAIFLVRILMQTSIAGIFGASITYISRRVPPERMAEIIGTLGTSGFIGILSGPQLADWIFATSVTPKLAVNQMFLCSAGLGVLAAIAAWGATRRAAMPQRRRQPPTIGLLRRYHPGIMLLVGAAVGAGVSLPNTFLRTFAAEREIHQIGIFFATYALVAFAVRISTRRLFERYGSRPWVLLGLTFMASSALLYLMVRETWQLVVPGLAAGIAHALLFPAVVAGGSTAFPERYRGLGTTLMLAMFDVGNLVGAPMIGGMLLTARWIGWPAYPTMFTAVAVLLIAVAGLFALRSRPKHPISGVTPRRSVSPPNHNRPTVSSESVL
jgi:MFS family permease